MLTRSQIIETALPVLMKHGVKRAGLFGSYADGTATEKSDIDLLVEMKAGSSLIELATLQIDLEDHFARKVDVVEDAGIKPLLRRSRLDQEFRFHE